MDTWASMLLGISGVLVAIGVIFAAIRKTARGLRRLVHVVDIIVGKDPIGGEPATLGLSARFANLEERLAPIEYQLKPNGGGSLHDKISRLEAWTAAHSVVHQELNERYFSRQSQQG